MDAILSALLDPLLNPSSRTFWGGLAVSGALAGVWWAVRRPPWSVRSALAALRHPSTGLDVQLYIGRQLIEVLLGAGSLGGAWWLATHLVRRLDGALGVPAASEMDPLAVSAIYSLVLFVLWDASRWALHWLMHRVPALWQLHQLHHSAEILTPLTFHRIHPLESLLGQLRSALVTGLVAGGFFWVFRDRAVEISLLGVSALGLIFNVATGNLRHSHVWLRFPRPVERWLLSPAQHQLHHSADPAHFDTNYGTWLAIWDRLAGTLLPADAPPARYGIPAAQRNHGDDLISAWFGPLRAMVFAGARGAAALALIALAATPARAQEAPASEADPTSEQEEAPEEEPRESFGEGMIVYSADGTPRAAGAAQALDEDDLAQFDYNDIERVLSMQVPSVSTRGEDGFGLRPNIGIRGANSDRSAKITLMEDGVLLAPAPYAAPAAYYFPMSTRLTGVEVFKGAAATRHGPHTVGGAINLLTRDVPDGSAYSADVSAGMYGTWKAHAWGGAGGERAGVLVEGAHLRSDGFKHIDGQPGGGETGFDRSELMLKGRSTPSADHEIELKLGYANETSNETYLGLTLDDLTADPYRRYAASALGLMNWNRTQAELAWRASPNERLQIRTVAYHHWLDRAWTKFNAFADGPDAHDLLQQAPASGQSAVYLAILRGEEDTASADQALMIGTNDRAFHSFGLQSDARLELDGERADHALEWGARFHSDVVDRVHTEIAHDMIGGELVDRGEGTITTLDSRSTAHALALHLHEETLIGRLYLLPGARVEVIRGERIDVGDDPEDPITRAVALPGAAVLYELTDWTDLFAGAHRGFSPVAPGQPAEVDPETSWNYEAGVRAADDGRHVELVGFFNDYQNITGQCTLSGGCDGEQVDTQYNGGAAWIYGAEAIASYTFLLPGSFTAPVQASYAWTRSRFRTGFTSSFPQFGSVEIGDSLPYVAEHQGGARLTLEHPRFDLGLGVSVRSGMLDAAGTFPVSETDIPPLVLLDAAARVRLTERFTLYTTGTNLTRSTAITSWRPFGARPTAPPQINVGITASAPPPDR